MCKCIEEKEMYELNETLLHVIGCKGNKFPVDFMDKLQTQ